MIDWATRVSKCRRWLDDYLLERGFDKWQVQNLEAVLLYRTSDTRSLDRRKRRIETSRKQKQRRSKGGISKTSLNSMFSNVQYAISSGKRLFICAKKAGLKAGSWSWSCLWEVVWREEEEVERAPKPRLYTSCGEFWGSGDNSITPGRAGGESQWSPLRRVDRCYCRRSGEIEVHCLQQHQ